MTSTAAAAESSTKRPRSRGAGKSAATPAAEAINEPFAARRARLLRSLQRGAGPGAAPGTVAAVLVGAHEQHRNGDVEHEFRQTSTFHYVTGFDEPESVAVLRPGHEHPYVLFVRPYDEQIAVWVGPRAGVSGATERYGADLAYPIEELDQRLPQLLSQARTIYYSFGALGASGGDDRVQRLLTRHLAERRGMAQRGAPPVERVLDPFPLIAALRLVKSREEVTALQQAIDITGVGIAAAMRATRPGLHEYEVQAVLEAEYRRSGSPRNGFPSIVATGANACTLHYTDNRAQIGPRDLLLLDTGAEVDYYAADVSRTFPASGKFTAAQRDVYDVVLEAQRQAIALVAPGVRFHDVHDAALKVLVRGLRDLGVLEGRPAKLTKDAAHAPYFMHGTSHWLGLDVHDAGNYREDDGATSIALRPGMVLTVEPGLYIAPDAKAAPRRLRGIGIRIEDDILVTRTGHRNLSEAIPRDPEVLEGLVGS